MTLRIPRRAAVAHLSGADPVLAKLIERAGPYRIVVTPLETPFEALLSSIVSQQLTGKAARTIHARLCERIAGGRVPSPQEALAATEETLRGAGLSRAKTAAVRDLATKTLDGTLPGAAELAALSDDEIVERLTVVRGIGRWTVEMLLMFTLGRPDVLPVDDYGVRNGYRIAYRRPELPTREELAKRGERWRPYRSAASWYLWRAVDMSRAAAKPAAKE